MSTIFMKPYSFFFSSTLIFGIFLSLTSNNWFMVWGGLELNLYSILPLMLLSSSNQEKEGAIKYFLTQAFASILLLAATITSMISPEIAPFLILTSLIIKLGLAPMHFWLPPVMAASSWSICWLISTIQKIAPMLLLTQLISMKNLSGLMLISISSTLIGAVGGINQTQLRAIMAYSSIGHMGWMVAGSLISPLFSLMYLFSYIIILTPLFTTFSHFNILASSFYTNSMMFKIWLILNILSLGGLPPLFGFFPKFLVLLALTGQKMYMLAIFLIISSTVNLFYYLKICFNMFFSPTSPISFNAIIPPTWSTLALMFILSTTSSSLFLSLLML